MYSQIVRQHFAYPCNVGELNHPDAVGMAKNEIDGDKVQLHLQIRNDIIVDIKMKVMGCVAAIASTSLLTEMIKRKSVKEAMTISKESLSEALGGLPDNKIHCSLTCIDALHAAINNYKR